MVTTKLCDALTVAELIERLQDLPPGAIPVFAVPYGDHGRTMQALPITRVEAREYGQYLSETRYSESGLRLNEEDGEEADENEPDGGAGEDTDPARNIVILRS